MSQEVTDLIKKFGNKNEQDKSLHVFPRKKYVLSLDTMNENIVKMQNHVKGPVVVRAGEIEDELAKV